MLAEVEPGVLVLRRDPDAAGEDLAEHEHDAEGHGEPLELKWRVSLAEV